MSNSNTSQTPCLSKTGFSKMEESFSKILWKLSDFQQTDFQQNEVTAKHKSSFSKI
jgi:hypothetical protein